MDLAPGTQVTDNVRLVSVLGEGGMGSVWVAEHLSLRTRVAVKFLAAELMREDPGMMQRFEREAALSAQIKSPHVVQTFDHGLMADGRPFIVMELLDGESLAERLHRTRILHVQETLEVVSQTAKALSKAHKAGVVHRDIKPDNLFLSIDDGEMHLKVLDFGIAKQTNLPKASSVTGTGMMVGTPEYMSPEQVLSARSVDARSDLWALAVVAYHCLVGGVPFTGETLGSLCVAIAGSGFVPPSQYRPELPPSVDSWFLKALAKDPNERFASAKELAVTFARAVSPGAVVHSDPFSISDPAMMPDWTGPHPQLPGVTPPATPNPGMYVSSPSGNGSGPALEHAAASPPNPSPTFAGATMSPAPSNSKRVAAAVVAALLMFGAAGVGAFVMLRGPEGTVASPPSIDESETAAAEPEPAPWDSATLDEPEDEPALDVSAEPEPSASAPPSASASAQAAPAPRPPPPRVPRPHVRPPPPPTNAPKDRGF